jgi:hypothetical protein
MSELAVISEARGFCINQSAILCKPSALCEDVNLETFEDSEIDLRNIRDKAVSIETGFSG